MDVSIICVNWNSLRVLRNCLTSIYAATRSVAFEIIIVDNASPEGGVDILQKEFPEVKIVRSEKNLGFAGANNLGFRYSSGANLLFLNPDTELVSPAIEILLRYVYRLPDAGVLGCKLLNSDLSLQTSCIQRFPTILNQMLDVEFLRMRWPHSRFWGIAPLLADADEAAKVEVISGACMLISREVFEKVGMFNTEYFMYGEDLELCYEVKRLGFDNYYVNGATVIHHGQKSSSKQGSKPIRWAMMLRCKSVMHFCTKTRGSAYGTMYRITMGTVAAGRLLILALIIPFAILKSRDNSFRASVLKWMAVLEWAVVGFDLAAANR